MDDFIALHSSDLEPDRLEQLLADRIAEEQAREFRRFFLTRLAVIIAGVWLLSWPVHLLPHTLLWALLAIASLVIGLTWPARNRPPTPGTPLTRLH
jgi:hypothetical protein